MRKGSGRTIRPPLMALLYAYAPGRRKIKVPVLAGRNDPDRASFRLRSGGMTDSKGVDSIGRGRGSDGKRGGTELRREGRRRCAAVVLLV